MMFPAKGKAFSMLDKRPRRRPLRIALWAACAVAALLLLWCAGLYRQIVTFEGVDAAGLGKRADVGVVLGASLWQNKPSPGLRERLDYAISLYDAGVYSRIIVTGGLDAGGATITEAEGMRDYLVEQGVPEKAIRLDATSRSTYENLVNAKAIMAAEGWHTAVIVTHSYHGARARDIADTLGMSAIVSVTDSKVMNMAYHETRETLAFVKWQLTKLRLAIG
ncbi:YdcF family protein [Cohnella candidum]|nr:YdcF family protein [Cohnella candidum]